MYDNHAEAAFRYIAQKLDKETRIMMLDRGIKKAVNELIKQEVARHYGYEIRDKVAEALNGFDIAEALGKAVTENIEEVFKN